MASDGRGVVGHAGARLLADLAEATGLEQAFSAVLAPSRQRSGGHDPGRVAVDVAVMPADGGETISDLAVLRDQASCSGRSRRRPRPGGCWTPSTTRHWPGCDPREQPHGRSPGRSILIPAATSHRPEPQARRYRGWCWTSTPAS
ncbi:transposase [Catenulispora sp. NL8]|uniref:Transposase n=1 Tax=Catenulispora pinistramenti TaxID=2705254 RepID=A0ABS5KQW6_9ACTN|nr:transposase [Catenulispora pinistramenti]